MHVYTNAESHPPNGEVVAVLERVSASDDSTVSFVVVHRRHSLEGREPFATDLAPLCPISKQGDTLLLARFPRVSLCELPTPVQRLRRYGALIGHDALYIKRDDLTGLATGGTKSRNLEFLLGDALSKGADVILTESVVQSNHCRQTAAACAKLGLECVLVLNGREPELYQANLLMDYLAGARFIFAGDVSREDSNKILYREAQNLERRGRRPYVIPFGGSVPRGALGYVNATLELVRQCNDAQINLRHVVVCKGTGGTSAGITVASALLGKPFELHVVVVEGERGIEEARREILEIAEELLHILELRSSVPLPDAFVLHAEYLGEGYSIPTPAALEAIRQLAQTEGIFVGPVHGGKGIAALRDLVHRHIIPVTEPTLFWHTGGTMEIFARPELFQPLNRGGTCEEA